MTVKNAFRYDSISANLNTQQYLSERFGIWYCYTNTILNHNITLI